MTDIRDVTDVRDVTGRTDRRDESWWKQGMELLPYGTQTVSKQPYPGTEELFPHYVDHAKGCTFTAVNGKRYLDYFGACGPIILGHAHDEVDEAVRRQQAKGFLYSTNSPLEIELAYRLRRLFPYIGWVKYLKTGADAVSAAVRIARAHTRKENVLHFGYHGWHDWYQAAGGVGRSGGIPETTRLHARSFAYNEVEQLERLMNADDNLAAVVMTPYDWYELPAEGYLQTVRQLCSARGVVLIFDEVKTGFRLDLRGAQGVFGVEPDLTVFAKAISNGYPLSVVAGRKEYLAVMNRLDTVISTTYAGDALALAAALATLDVLERAETFAHVKKVGRYLMEQLTEIFTVRGLAVRMCGFPTLFTLQFPDLTAEQSNRLYLLWTRAHLERGIFLKPLNGLSYTMMLAHGEQEARQTVETADQVLEKILPQL